MAYDLPFMSKARRGVNTLPKGPLVPSLPPTGVPTSPVQPVDPVNPVVLPGPTTYSPDVVHGPPAPPTIWDRLPEFGTEAQYQVIDDYAPDWLVPLQPGERYSPVTGRPEPIPSGAIPTADITPASTPGQAILAPEEVIRRESRTPGSRVGLTGQPTRTFGRDLPENAPHPDSPFYTTDPRHLMDKPMDFHTGARISVTGEHGIAGSGTQLSIPIPYAGAFLGTVHIGSSFLDLALMPEDAILNTAVNIIQGDAPTLFTEGFGAAVEEQRSRGILAEVASAALLFGGAGAASRLTTRALKRSALHAQANIGERDLASAFYDEPGVVAARVSDEFASAADDLGDAVDDIVRKKLDDSVDTYEVVTPNALDLQMTEGALNNSGVIRNITRALTGKLPWVHYYDDFLKPIIRAADDKLRQGGALDNLSNIESAKVSFLIGKHFDIDEDGLIPQLQNIDSTLDESVNYMPGIQDVAARLDTFRPHLSAEQLEALEEVRKILAPWRKLMDDVHIEVGSRSDVTGTGFYIPRGTKQVIAEEFAHFQKHKRTWKSVQTSPYSENIFAGSTRKDFMHEERFPSVSMGVASIRKAKGENLFFKSIEAAQEYIASRKIRAEMTPEAIAEELGVEVGSLTPRQVDDWKGLIKGTVTFEYANIGDTIHSYIKQIGEKAVDHHTTSLLKQMTDSKGVRLAETPRMRAERLHGGLSKRLVNLRNSISTTVRKSHEREGVHRQLLRQRGETVREVATAAVQVSRKLMKLRDLHVQGADIKQLRVFVDQSHRTAESLQKEIQETAAQIRAHRGKLTEAQESYMALANRYAEEIYEAAGHRIVTEDPDRAYFVAINRLDRMHRALDNLVDYRNKLDGDIDELMESGAILKDLKEEVVAERLVNRRQLRLQSTRELQERSAQAALKVLEMEEYRRLRKLFFSDKKIDEYKVKMDKTEDRLTKLRGDLGDARQAWDDIMDTAEVANPIDRGKIDIRGLEKYDFPIAMAEAVNRAIDPDSMTHLERVRLFRIWGEVNRQYLGFKATWDDGVIMLQGLLGIAGTRGAIGGALGLPGTRDFAQSMKWHVRAWRDPKTLGAFIMDFDRKTRAAGRLLSEEWGNLGLRVGGQNHEYAMRGWAEKLPGAAGLMVRVSNRAFGYYGDSRRLMWADDMLEEELSKGRHLKEIMESGDGARIAEIANNMTGWSKYRAGGSIGELGLLAPRYYASRIETVYKAAMGLLPWYTSQGVKLGPRISHRMARRSILRTVTTVAFLTEMVNEMQGVETDWRPIVLDKQGKPQWNPNFVRMRIGYLDKDVAMLGPFDSILRMIVGVGVGTAYAAAEGNTSKWVDMIKPFRGAASGTVSNIIDFMFEFSEFDGKPLDTPLNTGIRLAKNFVPMAAEKGLENSMKFFQNPPEYDYEDIGKSIGSGVLEFLGVKNAPMGYLDVKQELANEIIESMSDEERKDLEARMAPMSLYDWMSGQRYLLDNLPENFINEHLQRHPDILDQIKSMPPAKEGTIEERVSFAHRRYREKQTEYLKPLDDMIQDAGNGKELDLAISTYKGLKWEARNILFKDGEISEYLSKREPNTKLDEYRSLYHQVPVEVINAATGEEDWAGQDYKQQNILIQALADVGEDLGYTLETIQEEFDRPLPNSGIDRVDRAIMQNYEWHKALRPYWDVAEEYLENPEYGVTPEDRVMYELYRQASSSQKAAMKDMDPSLIERLERDIAWFRHDLRYNNPDIDVAFVRLGRGTALTDEGRLEEQRMNQEGMRGSFYQKMVGPQDEYVEEGVGGVE